MDKHSKYLVLFTLKQIYLCIFVLITITAYSQKDTTTSENGFSIFGGLGVGGNEIKQGFARCFEARFHRGFHTIDGYLSKSTKYEADYTSGNDLTLTYNSFNSALTYGYGIYKKHYSFAAVAGVGYTSMNIIIRNPDINSLPIFLYQNYTKACGVIGLQAGIRSKFIGLGAKMYYNVFDGPSTYIFLAGIEITLN